MAIQHLSLLGLLLSAHSCSGFPQFTNLEKRLQLNARQAEGQQETTTAAVAAPTGSTSTTKFTADDVKTNATLEKAVGVVADAIQNTTTTKLSTLDAVQSGPDTPFALLVCGDKDSQGEVASDSRDPSTWNDHDMDGWIKKTLQPYIDNGYKSASGFQYKNLQKIILYQMGVDGSDPCGDILNPGCTGNGLKWENCKAHPEAFLWWFATTHWAIYLNEMNGYTVNAALSIPAGDLVKKFFTPQKDPQKLLVPFGISGGVLGAISSVFAPAGVVAGAFTIGSAIVTQAGLDRADPKKQWLDVDDTIKGTFRNLTTIFGKFFDTSLKSFPKNSDDLYKLPNLPAALSNGVFAEQPEVGSLRDSLYAAIASAAINSLWSEDQVFMMIMDDTVWNQGDGKACQAYPDRTSCKDGVAYMLFRWKTTQTKAAVTPGNGANPTELDESQWAVRGAAKDPNGGGNDEYLADYALSIDIITTSVLKTWNNFNQQYPFTGQEQAITDQLNSHQANPSITDYIFFSLPVCDLRAVMGPGKGINHKISGSDNNPLGVYGGCLCMQAKGWPKKMYPLDGGLPTSVCNKQGIVKPG